MIDTKKKYGKIKKDELEHVVSMFFEKRPRRSKKKKLNHKLVFGFVATILILLCVVFWLIFSRSASNNLSKTFFISPDKLPHTIEYNFNIPGKSKVRSISLELGGLDLNTYATLIFAARTVADARGETSIRVQLKNNLNERDTVFVSGVNQKWKEFRLPISEFSAVQDHSSAAELTFLIEEWNVSSKHNGIIIDNVRFVQ